MSLAVVGEGSLIKCHHGLTPSPLTVLPDRTVTAEGMLIGNITDMVSLVNIHSFGMCSTIANPEVKAATAAAEGVLTPVPCIPVIVDPWLTEAFDVIVQGSPALDESSTIMCTWRGSIHIEEPGNFTVMVP